MTKAGQSFTFYAADGSSIRVGHELGRGGEGVVYELANRLDQVAKIYLAPIDSQKEAKLQAMVSQCTAELTGLAAWPSDLVLDQKRRIAGLIMKRVTGFRPVHELYTPKSRLQEFPKANWAFLVHAATNVARAFAAMHSHQIVIGDVNHGNVLVDDHAMCVLIDCDSFQVSSNGNRFLCEVGVSAYTPPELQGKDFATIVRTENHDNFGLALLIFHLLLMGRHPFAGRFLGSGEMPVERAISEYRFAFSANRKALQMESPPNSLALSDLPQGMASMFEQAFSSAGTQDSGRPQALRWIEALETLARDLIKCARNSSHMYYKQLTKCPWCRLEGIGAIAFFLQFDVPYGQGNYNVDAIWARISSVPGPGLAPLLYVGHSPPKPCVASPEAKAAGRRRKTKIAVVAGIVAAGVCYAIFASGYDSFIGLVIAFLIAARNWTIIEKSVDFRAAHDRAAARYESLQHRWEHETSDTAFFAKRMELEGIKKELEDLPRVRHERMQELDKNRRQIQFQRWMDRHYIRTAVIPGIGPGRKAILTSYGIDTAADLSWRALEAVHGIGDRYASALMQWHDSIAAGFRFNPQTGIDAQELATVEREIGNRRHYLQQRLSAGIPELQIIRERTFATRTSLQSEVFEAFEAFMQAEVDLKAC